MAQASCTELTLSIISHLIDMKIFFRNYFEIDKKKSGSVWHPVFDFANLTYYEQTKVYGGADPHRLMYYKVVFSWNL